MRDELNNVILSEKEALGELLALMEEQSQCALQNRIMDMEAIVPKIEASNRKVASLEMKRREITKGKAMTEVMKELNDKEIEENYRKVKKIIEAAIVQKDFNMVQLKQGLNFTNRILNILNPERGVKTYNSYGKIKR